jgi:uncharacterized protein
MSYWPPKYEDLIAVKTSKIQGRGVFALRRILKGRRVIEYVGEVIPNKEAQRRADEDGSSRHHTFLFELDSKHCIDAAFGGNISRFINHSCSPNCEAVVDEGHIHIYAKRNIQPGVELTYDYSFDIGGRHTRAVKEYYACYCGSSKCRGTILKPKRRRRRQNHKTGPR